MGGASQTDEAHDRALVDYKARQAQQVRHAAAMVTQARPALGGTFGRKRT